MIAVADDVSKNEKEQYFKDSRSGFWIEWDIMKQFIKKERIIHELQQHNDMYSLVFEAQWRSKDFLGNQSNRVERK